jgi:hypothetical protein
VSGAPEITGISRVAKPTEEKISASTVDGIVILKPPSLLVCVAVRLPFAVTVTPANRCRLSPLLYQLLHDPAQNLAAKKAA